MAIRIILFRLTVDLYITDGTKRCKTVFKYFYMNENEITTKENI